MSLFGKLVKTAVNVAVLPIDIVKDVVTLGGRLEDDLLRPNSHIMKQLEKIKEEADE
jgi:hypothetical protein